MRKILVLVCLSLFAVPSIAADNVAVSKMALVTLDGSVDIAAPVAKVWATLTDADKVQSWCPMWSSPPAGGKSLTAVGNSVAFKDDWGNSGTSVVVFVNPMKELRIAHVPENGSYMCQVKFMLENSGAGTSVKVVEQYSDDMNVPTDKDTALQMKNEIAKYMSDLKAMAEKK